MYREWKRQQTTGGTADMERYFNKFDKHKKGHLDSGDFADLLRDLFTRDGKDHDHDGLDKVFQLCDIDGDGKISKAEFEKSWTSWIQPILRPVTALVVVDVQNDFISGTLALRNCPAQERGEEVVPVINRLLKEVEFDVVVYTLDWHPADHISFFENVKDRPFHSTSKITQKDAKVLDEVVFDTKHGPMNQILWPAHCIQGSNGADFHPDLDMVENRLTIRKGCSCDVDSYSAFWDNGKLAQTELHQLLCERGVTDVYVCGLAYDVCVGYTATHSVEYGYRTVFIEDATRGVSQEGKDKFKSQLQSSNVLFVQSTDVQDLVTAKNRPLVLGKVSLKTFREKLKRMS